VAKGKRSPEAEYRRHIKRDAISRDKAEGCVCPNVRARVRVTPDGYDVVTEPHNPDCVLKHRKADVVVPAVEELSTPGAGAPRALIPHDAPNMGDDGAMMVVESTLWTP